jgi:hypothetical protein
MEYRQRVPGGAREIDNHAGIVGAGPEPHIAHIDRARGLPAKACEQQSTDAWQEQTVHGNKLTLNSNLFQVK